MMTAAGVGKGRAGERLSFRGEGEKGRERRGRDGLWKELFLTFQAEEKSR